MSITGSWADGYTRLKAHSKPFSPPLSHYGLLRGLRDISPKGATLMAPAGFDKFTLSDAVKIAPLGEMSRDPEGVVFATEGVKMNDNKRKYM